MIVLCLSKKTLVVLGMVIASVMLGCGSYSFSQETPMAGNEMRVTGKVVHVGTELRQSYHYSILDLQTVEGINVTISVPFEGFLCEAFGVGHEVARAKRGDEVELFGKVTGGDELNLCDSPSYYLKIIGPDETLNWKTYRSEKHGFEVKYPRSWTVRESSDYVGFRDSQLDEMKIKGDSLTIKIFRDIPLEEARYEARFQTREEAVERDFLRGFEEVKYFTQGSSAGGAQPAVETTINGLPALWAQVPTRIYGGDEDRYLGAGSGEVVFLSGDGVYTSIRSWDASVDVFDRIVSTFKFMGDF